MRKRVVIAAVAVFCVAVSGCATVPQATPVHIATPFDAADYAWAKTAGANTVSGNAVLRTVAGDPKTCAGLPVALVPGGAYTRARMLAIYGNAERGYIEAGQRQTFESDPPAYHSLVRQTTCDARGDFTFSGLPDGEYFVLSQVVWGVPMQYYTSRQGGTLMQRVDVRGGETKRIVLSP